MIKIFIAPSLLFFCRLDEFIIRGSKNNPTFRKFFSFFLFFSLFFQFRNNFFVFVKQSKLRIRILLKSIRIMRISTKCYYISAFLFKVQCLRLKEDLTACYTSYSHRPTSKQIAPPPISVVMNSFFFSLQCAI